MKMKNINWISIASLALIVLLIGLVFPLSLNMNSQENVIEVSQMAQKEVAPDKARITISIVSEAEDTQSAIAENTEKNNEIVYFFENDDRFTVETKQYSLNENKKWNSTKSDYDKLGYIVRNTIEITTQDLDSVGFVVQKSLELGANRVENVAFTLTKEKTEEIENELIAEAFHKTEKRAKIIAKLADKEITGVKSIVPSNFNFQPVYNRMYADADLKAGSAVQEYDFAPESQTVTMSVNSVFETK